MFVRMPPSRAAWAPCAWAVLALALPAAAQQVKWAPEANLLIDGQEELQHRGGSLDARGNWDVVGSDNDVLAGSFRKWDTHPLATDLGSSVAVYQGSDPGPGQSCQTAPLVYLASPGLDRFGWAVTWIGDLDGDSLDDFAVGAPRATTGGANDEEGRVYLFFSSDFAAVPPEEPGDASLILYSDVDGHRFGYSLAGAQYTGNAKPELAVGAPGGNPNFPQPGNAYLFPGHLLQRAWATQGKGTVLHFSDPSLGAFPFSGHDDDDRFGHAVAFCDVVSGDGYPEFAIGAPEWIAAQPGTFVTNGEGYVQVWLGGFPDVLWEIEGEADGSYFGQTLAGGMDVDANPGEELAIGAPQFPFGTAPDVYPGGKVVLWSPLTTGWVRTHLGGTTTVSTPSGPLTRGEELGGGVGYLGDVDADGVGDYGLASPTWGIDPIAATGADACGNNDRSWGQGICGRLQVVDGASGSVLTEYRGQDGKDSAGFTMSRIGDLDGNGKEEVLFSAFRWSPINPTTEEREVGRLYLFLSR